jgi:RNA polymerase subunit RPABC4/transcription elongation factor Spt4
MSETALNNLLLLSVTAFGAVTTAFWAAFIIWTYNDMKARARDPLAPIAAAVTVAVLFVFGLIIYVMLRPRETLADAYERSLEEEALLQEIEEKPACPGCGRAVKHAWQVCPYCHTKLKKPCVQCGQVLDLSWNLCPHCATPQIGYDEQLDTGYQTHGSVASTPRDELPASPYEVEGYGTAQSNVQESGVEWVDDGSAY